MSIYTSLSKFVANVITNNTVGVPVFLTTLSKSIWVALNFTNPIELGNSDFYNDPSSRKDVVFNPSDGKWYEKNGIFPNDQIFDTPQK